MERIIIEYFGAIKTADIEIKKYNFYIGNTSSGKSTIAKLIAIFNSFTFRTINEGQFDSFFLLLKQYNIDFDFQKETKIKYSKGRYSWEISMSRFHTDYEDADLMLLANKPGSDLVFFDKFIQKKSEVPEMKNLVRLLETFREDKDLFQIIKPILIESINEGCFPVYIPAERLLISIFSNSIFSLLQVGATIPDCVKEFGSLYEKARNSYKNIPIDIMNIEVSFSESGDTIFLKDDKKELKLTQASSGIQSILPLWTVLNKYIKSNEKRKEIIVIEEPELNLFPTTQYKLMTWIMTKMRKSKANIVITTHSPYILSAVDNLILGREILKKSNQNRDVYRKIKSLIPSMALVDFDEVSSYFFSDIGDVKCILDNELKSLGAEYIDSASNEIGTIFNELCKIEDEL